MRCSPANWFIFPLGPADNRSGGVSAARRDGWGTVVPRDIAASSWRSLLPITMRNSLPRGAGPGTLHQAAEPQREPCHGHPGHARDGRVARATPQVGVGARSAVGMGSLPGNITTEIEAIFEIDPTLVAKSRPR